MDTTHLNYFVTLAATRHFGKAAELCFISPSTLSRSIKQLERELNTQLFERDSRSVTLTSQGEKFLSYAQDSLQQWETINEELQATSGELQGTISIYCSVTASYSFLFHILTSFRAEHPLIEIQLHTGDPAEAIGRINSGLEDIAIAARPDTLPSELKFKRISYSPLVLICSKHSNLPTPNSINDRKAWKQLPIILSEKGIARERLDKWFSTNHISPNIYAQVAGNEAIVSMVSLGFGVGLVPEIVIDNSPLSDQVRPFKIQPNIKPYEVGICCSQKRLKSPLVAALWEQTTSKSNLD